MVSDYPLHVANSLIGKREIFYTALEIFFADKIWWEAGIDQMKDYFTRPIKLCERYCTLSVLTGKKLNKR